MTRGRSPAGTVGGVRNLSSIVKAYDIRGVVPDQLDEQVARAVGAAFVRVTGAERIVTARDMRESSIPLADAFAEGATAQGADVLDAGLGSTDLLYFASGSLDLPGAMFTASHNPARYNGIKLCRAGAAPVGQDTGLREIQALAEQDLAPAARRGRVEQRDLLPAYAAYLRGLVDLSGIRPLTVVVDAGNGMAGHTVPAVLGALPLTVVPMYFELDGSFPNHEANPLDPANLRDLQARVLEVGADIGLAFDGDADRCFVVDERGEPVSPSRDHRAGRGPGAGRAPGRDGDPQPDHLAGGAGDRPRARRGAGAHPGRALVHQGGDGRDRRRVRRRALGALLLPRLLAGRHRHARRAARARRARRQRLPLSGLTADYERYAASGEINSAVADVPGRTAAVEEAFGERDGATRGPPRRPDRVAAGRQLVQPAPVQHRAAAAAERRSPRRDVDDRVAGRRAGARPRRVGPHPTSCDERKPVMNLDPVLLEILACPDDHAPLEVHEETSELWCT